MLQYSTDGYYMQKKKKLPMSNKRIVISGLIIVLLSWLDYQYFTEAPYAYIFSEGERRLAHVACLLLMGATGYMCWLPHQLNWIRKTWVAFYASVLALMFITGGIQALTHIFPQFILNGVSSIRMFFCTPVPFFIMHVLTGKTLKRLNAA